MFSKSWFGIVLLAGLSAPVSTFAADSTTVGVGTGAVAGALVGGPIGAVVGAIAGGVIGSHSERARPHHPRRARVAYRRRSAAGPQPRTRIAEHASSVQGGIRSASAAQPAAAPRSASAIPTAPEPRTTATSAGAWTDPR